MSLLFHFFFLFFFFNDTAPTEIYPLSLHDALPISSDRAAHPVCRRFRRAPAPPWRAPRSRLDPGCRGESESAPRHVRRRAWGGAAAPPPRGGGVGGARRGAQRAVAGASPPPGRGGVLVAGFFFQFFL